MNKNKAHLEPGLFDIILYGRNRKPTVQLKFIQEGYYEIMVLTDYYRISQEPGTDTINFIDPEDGPMIAPGCILSNEYYDNNEGRWMPEKPMYYEVLNINCKIGQAHESYTFKTVTLKNIVL